MLLNNYCYNNYIFQLKAYCLYGFILIAQLCYIYKGERMFRVLKHICPVVVIQRSVVDVLQS